MGMGGGGMGGGMGGGGMGGGGCGGGGRPFWSLTSMGDTGNGDLAASAIGQALYEREKTGQGQWVETAIINAQLLNASHSLGRPDGSGFERPLLDADHLGLSAGIRLYATADGWLCLSLLGQEDWRGLASALGDSELEAGFNAGAEVDSELAERIEKILATRSSEEAFALLDGAGVPCEIASERASLALWSDPEAFERRWIVQYPHPMVGEIGQVGLAFSISETPARIQGPPTLVGEHTREILGEREYSESEIETLLEAGAVGDRNLHPALSGDSDGAVKSPWAPDT